MTFRMRPRSRGGNGGSYNVSSVLPGISRRLADAVLGDPYAQKKEPPKADSRRRGKHPDNVVLEIRRLREQQAMMPMDIVNHLAGLGYQVPRVEVIRLLTYATRSHLVPEEGAAPYINQPATEESEQP